jgi:hypothetical protein
MGRSHSAAALFLRFAAGAGDIVPSSSHRHGDSAISRAPNRGEHIADADTLRDRNWPLVDDHVPDSPHCFVAGVLRQDDLAGDVAGQPLQVLRSVIEVSLDRWA